MEHNPYQPPVTVPPSQSSPTAAESPHPSISVVAAIRFGFSRHVGFGNLAMGLLLSIIPVVGPVLLAGWLAETHRRLVRRESPTVRSFELGEFVNYLTAGLVPFVAQLVASLIAIIPMTVVGAILAGVLFVVLDGQSTNNVTLLIFVGVICGVLVVAAMAAMALIFIAAEVRAELTGSFATTFNLQGIGGFMKRQWKPIIGHSLLLSLLAVPLLLLGLLALVVGMYFVSVALQFAHLHLRWQLYESDLRQGGEMLPVFPGNGADL